MSLSEVENMKHEYEIIEHNNINFRVFLVDLRYRTPHIHRDFELCLVLEGSLTLFVNGESHCLEKNDIFIFNPFCGHEIKSEKNVLILSLQVSPSLFSQYYPQIMNVQFDISVLNHKIYDDWCNTIRNFMIDVALTYFNKEKFYEFQCMIIFNELFRYLLKNIPNHLVSENERVMQKTKKERIQSIVEYIDEHYSEKLLLTDIASYLQLDLYYLSHFFKECFGITFQNYLLKIRCEHARKQLLLSDVSLLDVSISSGFSDPKYFNRGFYKQYGCSPKEYRKMFKKVRLIPESMYKLSTQEFLTENDAISVLNKINSKK